MGVFEEYLSGATGPQAAVVGDPAGSMAAARNRRRSLWAGWGDGVGSDNPDAIANGRGQGAPAPGMDTHGTDWIAKGFEPAFADITKGSGAAGALLRQAYEGDFKARAAGYVGAQADATRSMASKFASEGLSPDVAARMIAENRAGGLQTLAAARGQDAYGLASDQAKLAKGTGTELAGLERDKLSQMVNYLVGQKAASATESAGATSAIGSIIGGLLSG